MITARKARAALVVSGVLGVLVVAGGPAFGAYTPVARWGSEGNSKGQFGSGNESNAQSSRQNDDPGQLVLDRKGRVVVVDPSNNRIERFTQDGKFLDTFCRIGLAFGEINLKPQHRYTCWLPEGIASDSKGNYYVGDSLNDRVMKYTSRWKFVKRLARRGAGTKPPEVLSPWGMTIHGKTLYVVDQGNYRVLRLALNGAYHGQFGHFGRRPGQFVKPYGVATSVNGRRVFVADEGRDRVIEFTSKGRFVREWGSSGHGAGQFLKAMGVAVAPDDTVFVSDRCNTRVERFTADGNFIETVGPRTLQAPTFLTFNKKGDLFVSDYHAVQKFSPAGAASRYRPAGPIARASHHNNQDIICRHVAAQRT